LGFKNKKDFLQKRIFFCTRIKKMSQGTFSPIPSSREEWLICFKEENEIRLSSEVQKLYDEGWNCNDLKRITMFVKNQVCNKKGFDPELYIPASMEAAQIYGKDPEFKEIALFFKYDTRRNGHYAVGMDAPEIEGLFDLNGNTTNLFKFTQPDRPLVISAGSYT